MLVIDFAKNYSFVIHNKVQSMHWHSHQISILVHITYYLYPNFDPDDVDVFLITKYHFYISDDHEHDSYFVQFFLQKHWNYMVEEGYAPSTHFVKSDGCIGQFKSRKP
jgi:hypothetical protein